ncbi:DUF1450 domain-containing protein [Geomicrobium sp. JCM 19038]|uniref:DUF1450 domain-containing protein n=1 Tax=Geomicrobium sp. JCM 19038 TaxID=1460635 RepID=UPI00045F39B5|nr:DUF1450 domain-containing protein [Geomicrobium sp. JCM 19038]GAK08158.1 hypothetical protein JCM19038_1932 [Geomicrobium sp. JCM 19038]
MGIIIVELCQSNAITKLEIESILEEKYPEVDVIESECLSTCGLCALRPFALVNGNRIFGDSLKSVWRNCNFELKLSSNFILCNTLQK